jgi:hypothetical protein
MRDRAAVTTRSGPTAPARTGPTATTTTLKPSSGPQWLTPTAER